MANLELLTVRDVAALFKVSKNTVHRLRAAGMIPAPIRLGRAVRWRAADLADAIASQAKPGAARQ